MAVRTPLEAMVRANNNNKPMTDNAEKCSYIFTYIQLSSKGTTGSRFVGATLFGCDIRFFRHCYTFSLDCVLVLRLVSPLCLPFICYLLFSPFKVLCLFCLAFPSMCLFYLLACACSSFPIPSVGWALHGQTVHVTAVCRRD